MTSPHGKQSNRLIHATSPYLLQHAYNPVDWYEWGTEALERAAAEDKPILVSIGYSACHWCHVMERESFEVDEIAGIMNAHFICIKVDREERPDIDQVYMEAVQAMGGQGGWPLNVFLNPSRQPFYGGTYFPPQQWTRLLQQIHQAFQQKRAEIDTSAGDISRHLNISDLERFSKGQAEPRFGNDDLKKMTDILESRFDTTWGGLEKAPKFVMPSIWMFLLRYHASTGDARALHMVTHTLKNISQAGLYDQLGGGFSRYSVDREWFAPHFEKMLYDNAQLLSLYCEAYAVTHIPLFKRIVYETVGWLEREMTHPSGGFYSALDADSEGIEGKFYTWTYQELNDVLGSRAEAFARHFNITPDGNWEGRNILTLEELEEEGSKEDMSIEKEKLMAVREKRVRPGLDDKILAGWNAMTIRGLTDAYRVFGEKKFLVLAESNMRFIEDNMIHDGSLYRSFKNKRSATGGFLEDYAFMIKAYTALYQSTFKEDYLKKAERWCTYTVESFLDMGEGYFHFTGQKAEALIARKKEIFDNVIPSSNSVMAGNLYQLGVLLDREDWKKMATDMVARLRSIIQSEPGYMSNWGIVLGEMINGLAEVVIIGPNAETLRMEFSTHYQPFAVMMGTTTRSELPLLKDRGTNDGKTMIYVCFNKTCKLPVTTVAEALQQLHVAGR